MMRGRRRSTWLVLPTYVVAAFALFAPPLPRLADSIASTGGVFDPAMQAYLLGWDARTLPERPGAVFDPPIFHPERRVLTYMDSMLGEAAVAAPVIAATGSVAPGYNALFLLATILSAWATYRLVRLFGVSRSGSWLCGFLFAWSPYRFANADLLNQLQTQFLPMGLFFAVRYATRWKFRDAIGVAACLVVQVYFGWYYACFLVVSLGLLLGVAVATRAWSPPRAHAPLLAALAVASLVAILPVAWPYAEQRSVMPGFRRTLGQAALYSADLLDYGKWSVTSRLGRWLGLPSGGASYWPGVVTAFLGTIGALNAWRRGGRERAILWLGASAFLFSLGPILHVAGRRLWIPLPYTALYFVVPGFTGLRAPARFAVLALLSLVVLAGIGFRQIEARWAAARPVLWRFTAIGFAALAVAFAWPRPLPLLRLPDRATMPAVYRWLAAQPDRGPILEVPVPSRDPDEGERDAVRQYCQLFHGIPRLDGCSGFVSSRYRRFRETVQSFPDDASLDSIEALGGRRIVVHYEDFPESARALVARRVAASGRLGLRARFGSDAVYALRPAPEPSASRAP